MGCHQKPRKTEYKIKYGDYYGYMFAGAEIATKKLQEENAKLKKDSEENQDLATIAYMQGASKNKVKFDEAKEIIREFCNMTLIFVPPEDKEKTMLLFDKANAFLKECEE